MSYSTRRSTGNYGQGPQNVGNIGQRRPVSGNFVSGGQLNKQPAQQQQQQRQQQLQNKPQQQIQNKPQQSIQQQTGIQFRNQNNQQQPQPTQPQVQASVQPQAPVQQQPVPVEPVKQPPQQPIQQQQPVQQQQPIQQQQPQPVQQPQPALQAVPKEEKPEITTDPTTPMEVGEVKKKNIWMRAGKVSRREKVRRRNVRLSKILQPKNAVMILNELVKNTSYVVEELPTKFDGNQFKASVVYEGLEHVGYGRSKINAKNSAAEAALKHYVRTNKMADMKKDDEGNEKMDVSEDDANQSPLPWQHVASFALYKLFCSWGEDPNIVKAQSPNTSIASTTIQQHENKPAKKMPENPETINPMMLINQMLPGASFEEIGRTGTPPNVTFSFRCNVNGQSFVGTGPNKKAAKKQAAFGACHKILEISYPPDIYVASY